MTRPSQVGGDEDLYVWRPVPPSDGFVAMGMVATATRDPPDVTSVKPRRRAEHSRVCTARPRTHTNHTNYTEAKRAEPFTHVHIQPHLPAFGRLAGRNDARPRKQSPVAFVTDDAHRLTRAKGGEFPKCAARLKPPPATSRQNPATTAAGPQS